MNWSDYAVIGLIAFFAVFGLFRGFIMSVYRLLAFFFCIYVSMKLTPVLSAIVEKTPVYDAIKNAVVKSLNTWGAEVFSSKAAAIQGSAGVEALLGSYPLPDYLKKSVMGNLPSVSELINLDGITNAIGSEVTKIIISILSLIILYIVLRIITALIGILVKGISKLPVFKQVDRIGGLVLGVLQGVVAIYIVLAVLVLFNTNPAFAGIFDGLKSSLFAGILYENNIIINLLFRP